MLTVLYPIMMVDLGFGYAQVGVLTAVQGMFGNATQAFYGFLAQFARRTHLLGVGNMILGLGVFLTGLVPSYPFLILARARGPIGRQRPAPGRGEPPLGQLPDQARNGPGAPHQHGPDRRADRARRGRRGAAGPRLAQIFLIAALVSFAMGAVLFFFRDRDQRVNAGASTRREDGSG